MDENSIIEPNEDNHIIEKNDDNLKNIILLFNLQSKLNTDINQKIETIKTKILDLTIQNHNLLININKKIDNNIFYNYIFFGISIIATAIVGLIKN